MSSSITLSLLCIFISERESCFQEKYYAWVNIYSQHGFAQTQFKKQDQSVSLTDVRTSIFITFQLDQWILAYVNLFVNHYHINRPNIHHLQGVPEKNVLIQEGNPAYKWTFFLGH